MADLPNGFTGFTKRDENFESAAEASRKLQEAIASGTIFTSGSTKSSGAMRGSGPAKDPSAKRASEPVKSFDSTDFSPEESQRSSTSSSTPSNVLQGVFGATDVSEGVKREAQDAQDDRKELKSQSAITEPEFDLETLDALNDREKRWAWAEIDLSAIRHNVAVTRRFLNSRTRLMAVVSADAYGHGAVQVSKAVLGAGADRLAVSTVPEGVELRKAGITAPILVLEQPPAASVPLLLAYNLTPTIYEPDFAVVYGEEADRHGMTAPYHLAVNTGLNRIGVPFRDVAEFLLQVSFHRALELEGVFTQLATAEVPETLDFQVQARRFVEALESLNAMGFDPGIVHAANSAATYRFPDIHFDMVRCGLSLYGVHPCEATRDRLDIRPAMSVHARITDTRIVPVSEGVSYGYQYRSPGSVQICTLPIGYADGLSRILSGNIDVIMDGRYYRQVGAICMNQCMFEIDLRNRKNLTYGPQVGDHVIIVGEEGAAAITIDELAEKARTIPYETLIGFGRRLPRIYR